VEFKVTPSDSWGFHPDLSRGPPGTTSGAVGKKFVMNNKRHFCHPKTSKDFRGSVQGTGEKHHNKISVLVGSALVKEAPIKNRCE
jgi:hypothetical protein